MKNKLYVIGFFVTFIIVFIFKVVDVIWIFKEVEHSKTYLIIYSVFLLVFLVFAAIAIINQIKSFKNKE